MFRDRVEAGDRLAEKLVEYRGARDAVVLAIPRGGVVVGARVALALGLPLDVFVVRKIGAPGNPELAAGAVDEDGRVMCNPQVPVSEEFLRQAAEDARREVVRRLSEYRGDRPEQDLSGKTVILVDDGIATGLTALKAVESIRSKGAARVLLATPVIAQDTAARFEGVADSVVSVMAPTFFYAVGAFYESFPQTGDAEVKRLLSEAIMPS